MRNDNNVCQLLPLCALYTHAKCSWILWTWLKGFSSGGNSSQGAGELLIKFANKSDLLPSAEMREKSFDYNCRKKSFLSARFSNWNKKSWQSAFNFPNYDKVWFIMQALCNQRYWLHLLSCSVPAKWNHYCYFLNGRLLPNGNYAVMNEEEAAAARKIYYGLIKRRNALYVSLARPLRESKQSHCCRRKCGNKVNCNKFLRLIRR